MNESKLVMAIKLSHVQQSLMGMEFEDTTLQTILPIIFKKCIKENLTFWFSFIENTAILNLRDVEHDNYELNIRLHYGPGDKTHDFMNELKRQLLINTFLITNESVIGFQEPASDIQDENIISSDKPMPKHIRKAIEKITAKGIDVTPETIRNHLPTKEMSTSATIECNKFLKEMGV